MTKKQKSEIADLKGVGPSTEQKLVDAGLSTLMSIAVSSPTEVSEISGVSEVNARKLIKEARDSLKLGFQKAKEFARRRDDIKRVPIGNDVFDNALGGGFESGCIVEVYGQYGSGKTQLAHLLAVNSLAQNLDNKVIYIDTENTFRETRIKDFSEAKGLDFDDVMDRIYITRAMNSDHQILLVEEVEKIVQQDNSYRVLIVDSLTSHFRSEYIGRGTLANRQQQLNKHMHKLLKIADLYNMIVFVTNQVHSNPGVFYGDPTTAVGGNIVGHNSTVRIYFRPGKGGSTYFKIVDSPDLPQTDGNFLITKTGFEEVK